MATRNGRKILRASFDMPAGEVGIFLMDLAADVPLAGPDRSLIYSVVLDTDRDPANDWVFNPPFDFEDRYKHRKVKRRFRLRSFGLNRE